MALTPGTHLGPYEVVAQIGAGGMGEVYRAIDMNLKRAVAIKVLPASVAADADRLARFQREAEVLASLNHPNIAAVYGLERSGATTALVMELVDGMTLADRIARGAIALDEALVIAKQIAEALETAHEQGIIHRDLKPANIKVRADGTVKVLDFGLAKAMEPAPGSSASMSMSPTITPPAMTQAGMILGTAAYMSPEQAKGRAADRRSDNWAFGCVVYEMLTGRRAFEGEGVSDTLASVLRADPRWAGLPSETPRTLKRLLQRCLQKDPKHRLQHIGDARVELDEPDDALVETPWLPNARPRRIWSFVSATVAVGALAGLAGWTLAPPTAPTQVRRYTVPVPASVRFTRIEFGTDITLSPDGRTLLYSSPSVGLLRRQADGVAFESVGGTEGGAAPFFSPDGAWIGFFAGGRLKKVPAEGGLAVPLCDAPSRARATWGDDGSILMASDAGVHKVSSNGGIPELILKADNEGSFAQPYLLPGSRTVLVRRGSPNAGRIEAVELQTLARRPLVEGTNPQMAATGDLLFEQHGGIWAMKFDAKRLTVSGVAVPVAESILTVTGGDSPQFSTAGDGSLAYIPGNMGQNRSLVWIDRAGEATAALEAKGRFQSPRLSPNGKRVIVSTLDGSDNNLWAYEFERGSRIRLTTTGNNRRAAWSPDGSQVAFYSTRLDAGGGAADRGRADQDLYTVPSAGGEPKKLLGRPGNQYPDTWSPDGRFLVFEEGGATRDLWVLPIGEAPHPLRVTPYYERGAVFSHDGRWLAFVTDESGRAEVYVQPFPGSGPPIPVSNNGGQQPMWSRAGDELFYREGDSMMAVPVTLDPFRLGAPRKLFEFPSAMYEFDQNFADYDIAPDGRFLAVQADTITPAEIHVVLNWTEELRRALGR